MINHYQPCCVKARGLFVGWRLGDTVQQGINLLYSGQHEFIVGQPDYPAS